MLLPAVETPRRLVTAVIELDARYTCPPKAIRQSATTERCRKKVEDEAARRMRRRGNLLGGRCLTPGERLVSKHRSDVTLTQLRAGI